jgi:hypothetical protein
MACEKCWNDAYIRARCDGRSQADHYAVLLKERKDNPCGPEWETDAYFTRLEKDREEEE